MSESQQFVQKLRRAGMCIVTGLAVTAVSVQFAHPMSFMAFAVLGAGGVVVGVGMFLWALARRPATSPSG
jgi:hypothetical protein